MKRKLIAVASAAMIGFTAFAIPNQAEARWRGHGGGWWVPGAVIGGLALGAIASSAYRPYYGGYGPYYGYEYGPYAYEDRGGPYYYEYGGSDARYWIAMQRHCGRKLGLKKGIQNGLTRLIAPSCLQDKKSAGGGIHGPR